MPRLVRPAITSLADSHQPSIRVGGTSSLRPWKLTDAEAVIDAYEDAAIQRWHVRQIGSIAEAQELITGWQDGWNAERACHWAFVDDADDLLLGRVALSSINLQDGHAGVAYWMVPAARGRGLCTNAVIAASEWAFREAGFHRLALEHSIDNPASARVAIKAGFAAEGVRRGAALHADGWHDMCVHSRLATDQTL